VEDRKVRLAIAPPARSARPAPPHDNPSAHAIPGPITFIYNEATFTDKGRMAAAALAQYLTMRQSVFATLSGHADERGSDQYNMALSQERLAAVADYLRAQGFAGRLQLIPKGKTEPYTGVDRHALPREDAFQLDRRVELRLAR
jgi:outer membrane protein OmpA-like peptidoglycan-associated protein